MRRVVRKGRTRPPTKRRGHRNRSKPPTKKPGQYNRVYPLVKASVRQLLEEVVTEDPERIKQTIRRHFASGGNVGFKFVEMAAAYLDGKPKTLIELEPTQEIHFHFHQPKEDD